MPPSGGRCSVVIIISIIIIIIISIIILIINDNNDTNRNDDDNDDNNNNVFVVSDVSLRVWEHSSTSGRKGSNVLRGRNYHGRLGSLGNEDGNNIIK